MGRTVTLPLYGNEVARSSWISSVCASRNEQVCTHVVQVGSVTLIKGAQGVCWLSVSPAMLVPESKPATMDVKVGVKVAEMNSGVRAVGDNDGDADGPAEGFLLGELVGRYVGRRVGLNVGLRDGRNVSPGCVG